MSASRAAALAAFKGSARDDTTVQQLLPEPRINRSSSQLSRPRVTSASNTQDSPSSPKPSSRPVLPGLKASDGPTPDPLFRVHSPTVSAVPISKLRALSNSAATTLVAPKMVRSVSRDRSSVPLNIISSVADSSDQEHALVFAAQAAVASRDAQDTTNRQNQDAVSPLSPQRSVQRLTSQTGATATARNTKPSIMDNTYVPSPKRALMSNSPQEVVKNLQESLKSKTITSSLSTQELSQKNQQILVDLRQSIENKRKHSLQLTNGSIIKASLKKPVEDQLGSLSIISPLSVRNNSSTSLLSNRPQNAERMVRSVSQASCKTLDLDVAPENVGSPKVHSPDPYSRTPAFVLPVMPASIMPVLGVSRRNGDGKDSEEFHDAQSDMELSSGSYFLPKLRHLSSSFALCKTNGASEDDNTPREISYSSEGIEGNPTTPRGSAPLPIPIPKSTQACSRNLAPSIMDEAIPAVIPRPGKSAAGTNLDDQLKKPRRRPPPGSSPSLHENMDFISRYHGADVPLLTAPNQISDGYASLMIVSSQDDVSAMSLYAEGCDFGDGSGSVIDRESIADSERENQETDPNSPYFDLDYNLEKTNRDASPGVVGAAEPETVRFLEDEQSDYIPIPGSRTSESTARPSLDALALLPKLAISPMNPNSKPVRLKTTMRDTKNHIKKSKKAFNEDKPWKNHSELAYLSEPERKRYEGIWVSNKGLYMDHVATKLAGVDYSATSAESPPEDPQLRAARISAMPLKSKDLDKPPGLDPSDVSELILGIVVKRLWTRSRLPSATLETIWTLVDSRKDGTLDKPGFLVGMWLVDQCLYGRKLPKKVDDIVWEKLGGIGVNVVIKKGRR